MPQVKCKKCEKKFYAKPSWLKNGHGIYCSPACQYLGVRKGRTVACFICGVKVYKSPQTLRRSKSKKYFCSKSCQTKWRNSVFIGPRHANWIHGQQAYRSVLSRSGVVKMCSLCFVKDGRVMATHHIDQNRKNNKLNNLAWLCHNCHFLVHHYDVERQKLMEVLV